MPDDELLMDDLRLASKADVLTHEENDADSNKRVEATAKSRGKYLGFWASSDLYQQVKDDALRTGLSLSDYQRELLSGAPVPRQYRAPNAARLEISKFIGVLGKLASNMNQLAKQANIAAKRGKWEALPTAEAIAGLVLETQEMLSDVQQDLQSLAKKQAPATSGGETATDAPDCEGNS